VQKATQRHLGLESRSAFELYALVPIKNEEQLMQHKSENREIGIRLLDSSKFLFFQKLTMLLSGLTIRGIEDML
jgi:hypothetical protein